MGLAKALCCSGGLLSRRRVEQLVQALVSAVETQLADRGGLVVSHASSQSAVSRFDGPTSGSALAATPSQNTSPSPALSTANNAMLTRSLLAAGYREG